MKTRLKFKPYDPLVGEEIVVDIKCQLLPNVCSFKTSTKGEVRDNVLLKCFGLTT